MKKHYILFLGLFFLSHISFSQIKSGEILYKVKEDSDKINEFLENIDIPGGASYLKYRLENIRKSFPYLKYHLTFDKNTSLFIGPSDQMSIDNGLDIKTALSYTASSGEFYTNMEEDLTLLQKNYLDKNWLISYNISELEWVIHNETKKIQGYTSQKAIGTSKTFPLPNQEVTAWFTTDIPFQFGPLGYAGLPGLILEIEHANYIFYADEILFSEKEKKVKRPTKGKEVTLQEYIKETKIISDQLKGNYRMQK